MENEKNIVNDKEMFNEFIERLKDVKNKDVYDDKDIEYIIEKVEGMKEYYTEDLKKLTDSKKIERFNKDLEYYYGKFFDKYDDKAKLFKFLEKHTNDYFFNKIISQLSHLRGELYPENESDKKCNINEDLINHVKLMLFLNYFETFPRYFEPIFFVNMMDSNNYKKYTKENSRKWYDFLSMLTCSLLEHKKIQKKFFDLRNNLAHSKFIVEGDKLIFLHYNKYDDDYIRKEENIREYIEHIEEFQKVIIIISTEFDLRILKLYFELVHNDKDKAYEAWKKYFDNYIKYWLQTWN